MTSRKPRSKKAAITAQDPRGTHSPLGASPSGASPSASSAGLGPDADKTKSSLTGVVNAVATVNAYCNALNQTVLTPVGNRRGDWFETLNAALGTAQAHATDWLKNLGPQAFSQIPQQIINYGNIFDNATRDVLALLAGISGTPTPAQQQQIVQLLQATLSELTSTQATLVGVQTQLQGFATNVQNDYTALNTGKNSAENQVLIDVNQLQIIQALIDKINGDIASDSQKAKESEIGLGVAIFITIAAFALAIETGGAALVVGCIGLAGIGASIGTSVWYSEQVKEDFKKLYEQQQNLTDEQRQVTALQGIVTSTTTLLDQSRAAQNAIASLLDAWAVLIAKLTAVVSDVQSAEAKDLPAIIAKLDLQAAQAGWGQLVDFCQGMQVSLGSIQTNTRVQAQPGFRFVPKAVA
jgi:hypothetical protein